MVDSLNISQSGEPTFIFTRGMRIDDVGYSRCFTNKLVIQQHVSSPFGAGLEQNNMFKTPDTTSRQYNPSLVSNPMVHATSRKGPSDFARHLHERYPELVSDPIAIFLREHNARVIRNMFELQQKYHEEITAFADKIMLKLSQRNKCDTNNIFDVGQPTTNNNSRPAGCSHAPPATMYGGNPQLISKSASGDDGCSATRSTSQSSVSGKRQLAHVTTAGSMDTAGSASSGTHNSGKTCKRQDRKSVV